jgi:DNA polymerase III subunit delta'
MIEKIIGHKPVLDFFDKVIDSDNISHAYCFVGQENIGKTAVAEEISAKLLGINKKKLKTAPDYIVVEQELNKKTGKTKKNIDIEQLRNLRSILGRHSFLGGYKIAVIDKAEKMNISAFNALLKTLEEPTKKTVLILLTNNASSLPETIQSRCQMINFYPVEKKEIQKYLELQNITEKNAEEIARVSHGLPGLAISWSEEEEKYNWYKQEVLRFESLINQPFFEKLEKIDELFGDKKDHIATREKLKSVLSIWQIVLRDKLCDVFTLDNCKIHSLEDQKNFTKQNILNIYNNINQAKKMLEKNIHPRLLVENILLELP